MTAADTRPVARLKEPGEMVAFVPHVCGFVPTESLVAMSLRGPRRRVGLTLRFDLPGADALAAAAAEVTARVVHDGGTEALLFVWTEEAGELVRADLVEAVTAALEDAGVGVQEALLVRGGRWWSYRCSNPRCCPPEGVPLEASSGSPALALMQATDAYDGRLVLPSREDLAASIEPPTFLAAESARQALVAADAAAVSRIERDGLAAVRADDVAAVRAAVDRAADPRASPDDAEVCALAVSLHDVRVRDEVLTWALDRPEQLLRLLLDVVRRTVAPYDVPALTMLAIVAWLRGDGAFANVALDRAWRGDPTYSLAALVREGLDQQVPPPVVREWLRGTRKALR
jgi:hypothetical protein